LVVRGDILPSTIMMATVGLAMVESSGDAAWGCAEVLNRSMETIK
jgi:hypothetical protein